MMQNTVLEIIEAADVHLDVKLLPGFVLVLLLQKFWLR